ncbi:MAG: sigma-54 interaction domain-containing protein [Planctomycetota bacterium]|jgi:PAS domain S-box-containing protein
MAALRRDDDVATNRLQNGAGYSALDTGFNSLVEILPVGVFILAPDQTIQAVNAAAAHLFGLPSEGALGKPCEQVLHCSFCGPTCAAIQAREENRVSQGFPTDIQRGDGTRRSVIVDAVPLGGGHVVVMVRDVTDGERLRRALKEKWVFHGLVCVSTPMKEIVDRIRDVAPYDSTVLILGESGTGKELVARALHAESNRADRPFVAVNCSAYSENLLESELFGHVRGSFTGAERDRQGRFELANGGTVFLDEIGEISPKIQVKLLRVLQEREIERVGDNRIRRVNLRIVAATNLDLLREVKEGRFREDLYYRLNVFTLALPPLRERAEDVPALADHFLNRLRERTGKEVTGFSDEVLDTFLRYSWPGNVRELENIVESALVRARGDLIKTVDVPEGFRTSAVAISRPEDRVCAALKRAAGNVTRAARLLGVHRTTLWRQMREAGLRREDFLPG